MGVVWRTAIVIEDAKGSKTTLKHYLPAAHYTFEQAQAYVAQYVAALDGVIAGAIRKVTLSQSVALAGLKTEPLATADVAQKLSITYRTEAVATVGGEVRMAKKSPRWRHTIPTFLSTLTTIWTDNRRVADRDVPVVKAFFDHLCIPIAYGQIVTDDHGIPVTYAERTELRFSRARKAKGGA